MVTFNYFFTHLMLNFLKHAQEKFENDWDVKISSNLSVVLGNEINLPEEEHPKISFHAEEDDEGPSIDEIR